MNPSKATHERRCSCWGKHVKALCICTIDEFFVIVKLNAKSNLDKGMLLHKRQDFLNYVPSNWYSAGSANFFGNNYLHVLASG